MGKQPAVTEWVTAEHLASICEELEQFASTLRRCETVARSQPGEKLAIYYLKSAISGLDRVSSFVDSADKSRRQASIGQPLEAGQLKPRSTAKTKSVEEVAAEIEAHRQSTKKKRK